MAVIAYSRWKLAGVACLLPLVALIGYGVIAGREFAAIYGVIVLLIVAIVLPWTIRYLISPRVVTIDHRGLRHHGILGEKSVGWDCIDQISIISSRVNGSSNGKRKLRISGPFGLLRRFDIFEQFLGGRLSTAEGILEAISGARQGGIRAPARVAMERPEPHLDASAPTFGRKRQS